VCDRERERDGDRILELHITNIIRELEVPTLVTLKNSISWNVAPCNLVEFTLARTNEKCNKLQKNIHTYIEPG
jgi:hypothetical protein